jgi:hypothetical protein
LAETMKPCHGSKENRYGLFYGYYYSKKTNAMVYEQWN